MTVNRNSPKPWSQRNPSKPFHINYWKVPDSHQIVGINYKSPSHERTKAIANYHLKSWRGKFCLSLKHSFLLTHCTAFPMHFQSCSEMLFVHSFHRWRSLAQPAGAQLFPCAAVESEAPHVIELSLGVRSTIDHHPSSSGICWEKNTKLFMINPFI